MIYYNNKDNDEDSDDEKEQFEQSTFRGKSFFTTQWKSMQQSDDNEQQNQQQQHYQKPSRRQSFNTILPSRSKYQKGLMSHSQSLLFNTFNHPITTIFNLMKSQPQKLTFFYLIFLILLLTQPSSSALTSLSTSNCPSQFFIKQANITIVPIEQSQQYISLFYSFYDTQQLSKAIDSMVINNGANSDSSAAAQSTSPWTQQISSYSLTTAWPYIFAAIAFLAIYLLMIVCCLFEKSCPPKSWRRDLGKSPYTRAEYRGITILTIIMGVGIVVACLTGLSYLPQLKINLEYTQCSIYRTLDSVLNGVAVDDDKKNSASSSLTTTWGGFNNLNTKISNVSSLLSQSLPSMQTYLTGDDWLSSSIIKMRSTISNIYRSYKDSVLITPNPATTQIAIDNSLPIPTIQSRFIQKQLGPVGQFDTMADDIDRGFGLTDNLASEAYQINLAAGRLIDSSQTVLANSAESKQALEMFVSQLKQVVNTVNGLRNIWWESSEGDGLEQAKSTQKSTNGYAQYMLYLVQAVFGLMLIASIASLIGISAVYFFKVYTCRSMVTCGWVIIGIAYLGIILNLYIILGLGSLAYGFCNLFDSIITSPITYNTKIIQSYSQNPFNRLDSCFYGNGNILSKFNLQEQMSTVTNLFEHIQIYYDYSNSLSANYVDLSVSPGKIGLWMTIVDNYRKGVFMDWPQGTGQVEASQTDDNPWYSLQSLNSYTQYSGGEDAAESAVGIPICSKDRWVFDKINCTNPLEQTYKAGLATNGAALQPNQLGKQFICMPFNQRLSTLHNQPFSQSDFNQRYKQIREKCPSAYTKILQYGYAIISYRNSRQNLFKGIYDQLNMLKTFNQQFNSNLTGFGNKVLSFQASASSLNEIVTGNNNGLLTSSDCRPIVDDVRFVFNSFCVNTMYDVVRVGWCVGALVVLGLVGLIGAYWWTNWFMELEEDGEYVERMRRIFQAEGSEERSESVSGIGNQLDGDKQMVGVIDEENGYYFNNEKLSSNQLSEAGSQTEFIKEKDEEGVKNIRTNKRLAARKQYKFTTAKNNPTKSTPRRDDSDNDSQQSSQQENPYIK